jgi:hypothetical protein
MSDEAERPVSEQASFHIIDDQGSRDCTRDEFVDYVAELERPGKPRPRYEHTDTEKRAGLWCSCQNCLDAQAKGRSFTAEQRLASVVEALRKIAKQRLGERGIAVVDREALIDKARETLAALSESETSDD